MNTSNIPLTGFKTSNVQTVNEPRYVNFNISALFTLSLFSVRQILLGVFHHKLTSDEANTLFRKLSHYALEKAYYDIKDEAMFHIELNRVEVMLMRKWLEARMKHCEEERDEESGKEKANAERIETNPNHRIGNFNPDTYIAQKFLLLDIREWLLGEIIE